MGNTACRDVFRAGQGTGVLPDVRIDSSFKMYLTVESPVRLSSDYADVRASLSPEQLGVFNHSLRATLGESGRVTRGGVGVVALALSFLFDVLGRQARNETGSTHFIQRVFGGSEGGNGSEVGTVVIDYLKLVPLIANDPRRMKEETERYEQRLNRSLLGHIERTFKSQNGTWADWKVAVHGLAVHQQIMIQRMRMGADIPLERLMETDLQKHFREMGKQDSKMNENSLPEIKNALERLRRISPEWQVKLVHCTGEELLSQFFVDAFFTEMLFFPGSRQDGPQLISQTEDFFY